MKLYPMFYLEGNRHEPGTVVISHLKSMLSVFKKLMHMHIPQSDPESIGIDHHRLATRANLLRQVARSN